METDRHLERRTTQEKKRSWTAARLCEGLPTELEVLVFTQYCLKLDWDEDPQYDLLRGELAKILMGGGPELQLSYICSAYR